MRFIRPFVGLYALSAVSFALTAAGLTACGNSTAGDDDPSGPSDADSTPPAEVGDLVAAAGDGRVALSWTEPTDNDFAAVFVGWAPGGTSVLLVPKGISSTTVTGLTNGVSYTFTVQTGDTAGNRSPGVTTTAMPAGSAPTVSFAPNGNSTAAQAQTVTVSVTAPNGFAEGYPRYQWTDSDLFPTGGTWTGFTSGAAIGIASGDGERYLHVDAVDVLGNGGQTTSGGFLLDNSAPVATLLGAPPATLATSMASIDITVAGDGVVAYKYKLDAALDFSAETAVATHITASSLADGAHQLWVTGRDAAGNWQPESAATVHSWTVLVNLPSITIVTDGNETPSPTQSTVVSVMAPNGLAADSPAYQWTMSAAFPTGGEWTPFVSGETLTASIDGRNYLHVIARDLLGGEARANSRAFVVDAHLPAVVFVTNGNSTPAATQSTVVNVTAANGLAPGYPQHQWTGSATFPTGGVWESFIAGSALSMSNDGRHYLHVIARDSLGGESQASSSLFIVDAHPPTITFAVDGNTTAARTQGTSVEVTALHGLSEGYPQYQWTTSSTFPTGGAWLEFVPGAAGDWLEQESGNGDHYLHVIAVDTLTAATHATSLRFVLDNQPPTALLHDAPASLTAASNINIRVDSADVTYYRYKVDDGDWSGDVDVATRVLANSLADGNHDLWVIGRDAAGNWQLDSSPSVTHVAWTVDATAPVVTLTVNGTAGAALAPAATQVNVTDAHTIQSLSYQWSASSVFPSDNWVTLAAGGSVTQPVASGPRYLHVKATDELDNERHFTSAPFLLSDAKQLTTFTLPSSPTPLTGTINEASSPKTVTFAAAIPYGVSVDALVATFAVSNGATTYVNDLAQSSGVTANDFREAVDYVVRAADGTTATYRVTVGHYEIVWTPSNSPTAQWLDFASSDDGNIVYGAMQSPPYGTAAIFKSTNGGVDWTPLTNSPNRVHEIVCSGDGAVVMGITPMWADEGKWVAYSTNSGATWTKYYQDLPGPPPAFQWTSIAVSADGHTLAAGGKTDNRGPGYLFVSRDSGARWDMVKTTVGTNPGTFSALALSPDGLELIAGEGEWMGGSIYVGTFEAGAWSWSLSLDAGPYKNWYGLVRARDGSRRVASCSFDGGVHLWTATSPVWQQVHSVANSTYYPKGSADAMRLISGVYHDWPAQRSLEISLDGGVHWQQQMSPGEWWGVATSADGTHLIAAEFNGRVYVGTPQLHP